MTRTRTAIALVTFAVVAVLAALTGTSPLMLGGRHADAVVGRPLTPMSYAGVARRTTRRTAYAAAATPHVATTTVITTLPAGCTRVATGGTIIYQCGGARYQPYYDGPTLVYRPI